VNADELRRIEPALDHIKSVEARHLDVEKYQVRVQPADGVERRVSILTFCDDLDRRFGFQQRAKPVPGQRLVDD